jgi:hypothetical protein
VGESSLLLSLGVWENNFLWSKTPLLIWDRLRGWKCDAEKPTQSITIF